MPTWIITTLCLLGGFLYHISPSLVGVILGGWLIQRYWIRKSNESAVIEYLARELTNLVDTTMLYWSIDCVGTGKDAEAARKQARQLAAKIKAESHNLQAALRSYSEKYCGDVKFEALCAEVHDACTGGSFEKEDRPADPDRYFRVVCTTNRLRWKLYDRRV